MKKFFLVVVTILPMALSAQNGITISNFAVPTAGTITFDISWKAEGMPPVWLDSAWVFVDYNDGGVMKRLPLNTGATLLNPSAQGAGYGIVIEVPGNNQGVWVVGKTRNLTSSFSATVALPFNPTIDVKGACAYASNYPPYGDWNPEGTLLTLAGTPPYILQLTSATGSRTEPVLGSTYTLPNGYTLDTFTDKTGAPGITRCKPSTPPTSLTASVATVCSGAPLTLTAGGGLDGSGALFQWGSGAVGTAGIIGQSAANTFSAAATVSTTSAVTYWVRRISTDGCAPTAAVTVAVNTNAAPAITPPANTSTCYGTATTLIVSAQPGSGSISSYLWKKNGNNAPGANTAISYVTEALTTGATYTVTVTNSNSCSATSGNVLVSIDPLPTINTPPAAVTICNGAGTNLSVTATANTGTPTYQWYKSGAAITSGGQNNTLATGNLTATTSFYVVVSNAAGCSITSSPTTVTVRQLFTAGAIDAAGGYACFNGTPTVINSTTAASGGDGSIAYKWQYNGADIDGATSAAYTPATAYASSTGTKTFTRFAHDGTCNTGWVQSTNSYVLTVYQPFTPGSITTGSQTINSGAAAPTATNLASASGGDGSITYKWQRNGGDISGATDAAYTPTAYISTAGTHTFTRLAKDGTCSAFTQSAGSFVLIVQQPAGCDPSTGVTVGTLTWACANVDASGVFATSPDSYGKFFKWNEPTAYAISGTDNNYTTSTPSGTAWSSSSPPCPSGWRVPTNDELRALNNSSNYWKSSGFNTVGRMYGADSGSCNSTATMAGKQCVFLPAGGRRTGETITTNMGENGMYWSSTENTSKYGLHMKFDRSESTTSTNRAKYDGLSVRCVK